MNEDELLLQIRSLLDNSGFKAVESETKKAAGHMSALGGAAKMAGAAIAAGLAVGTAAAVAFGVSAIKSAERLGDAQARVNGVFGESAKVIDAAAKSQATALGLSNAQFKENTGSLGDWLTATGLSNAKSAEMAVNLTELAPKMAAFKNVKPDEMLDAFQKGLHGSTKQLEALGVDLDKHAIAKMNDAQKAAYVYQQVLKASGPSLKAWGDNQKDVGQSTEVLKAAFENIKATLGEKLLPILAPIAEGVAALMAAFDVGGLDAVAAKFKELTGIDVSGYLKTAKDIWADLQVVAKAFYDDVLVPTASYMVGTVIPAVAKLVGWMKDHKEIVTGVALAYVAFKTAMVIGSVLTTLSAGITAMGAAWTAFTAGEYAAAAGALGLDIALSPVAIVVLAIAAAVGLLTAAWIGDWGHIREKTAAVVDWIKTVPAQFVQAWENLKTGLANLSAAWSAKWAEFKAHPLQVMGELLAYFAGLYVKMLKLGADIVRGLWDGVKGAWRSFIGWLSNSAGDIVHAVAHKVEARSPSQVMYRLGRDIMLGLSLGISAFTVLGVTAARSAADAMLDVFGQLAKARDDVARADVIARAAAAAVAGALAADGVVKQARESSADAWKRYYDEMMRQEDELNKARVQGIADAKQAATDKNDADRKAMEETIAREKRHFEWLKDQEAQEAQHPGGRPAGPMIRDFGTERDRIANALAPMLALLDPAYIGRGTKALADFWKKWNDDINANINTNEDLGKAIDAVLSEMGKKYDELQKGIDDGAAAQFASEEARHQAVVKMLNDRAAIIDALIKAQENADADLSDLIAIRDALLQQAKDAIALAQKAAETAEDKIHDGVMAAIEEERKAVEASHRWRMTLLTDEKRGIDAMHERRLAQIQAQRDKITEGFDERERQIAHERSELDRLKLDLGVEEAAAKLATLKQQLEDLRNVAESFVVVLRGKDANDAARKAIVDRVKVTTDAQRHALEAALASGTLDEKDRRRVELLLLGRGSQRLTDVQRILAAGQQVLQGQIDYQQEIVDSNTIIVNARTHLIEMAEQQLKLDRDASIEQLKRIDDQVKAENERYARETANIQSRMTLEQQRYEDELARVDAIADAESRRHEQRMGDIAAEYALELAKLGMTQAEIDAMVAAATAEAKRIAKETEETFKRLKDAAGAGTIGSVPGLNLGGSQPIPITPIGAGGGPIGSLRPGGGPSAPFVLDLTNVAAKSATVDKVDFGGMSISTNAVLRLPSGREIALETVDALLDDATLLDKLGKKLNERKATSGQIGGHP